MCASRAGGYGRKTEEGMRCGPPQQDVCMVVAGQGPQLAQDPPHAHDPGVHAPRVGDARGDEVKRLVELRGLEKHTATHQAAGADVCVRRVQVLQYGRKTEEGMRCGPPLQDVCTVAGQGPQRPRFTTRTRPRGTYFIVVTLEVSRLSGWLNTVAP